MKNLFLFAFILLTLAACKKNGPTGGVTEKQLSREVITSGSFMGLTIGSSTTETYATVQAILPRERSFQLAVGIPPTDLDSIANSFQLYDGINIYPDASKSNHISIYFSGDKVAEIRDIKNVSIERWPEGKADNESVILGDATDKVYGKLSNTRKIAEYTSALKNVGLAYKNPNKVYDKRMDTSVGWLLNYNTDATHRRVTTLDFKDGKLISITATLYEQYWH